MKSYTRTQRRNVVILHIAIDSDTRNHLKNNSPRIHKRPLRPSYILQLYRIYWYVQSDSEPALHSARQWCEHHRPCVGLQCPYTLHERRVHCPASRGRNHNVETAAAPLDIWQALEIDGHELERGLCATREIRRVWLSISVVPVWRLCNKANAWVTGRQGEEDGKRRRRGVCNKGRGGEARCFVLSSPWAAPVESHAGRGCN